MTLTQRGKNSSPSIIKQMAEAAAAFAAALRLLAMRDHSEAELRGKLVRRGFPLTEIDQTVGRLYDLRYLDDRRFATAWATAALNSGWGVGPRLKLELQRRGVASAVIEATLTELAEEHDEQQVLAQLLAKRFAGFNPQTADERQRRRVYAYLQRRGFSLNMIFSYFRTIDHSEEFQA